MGPGRPSRPAPSSPPPSTDPPEWACSARGLRPGRKPRRHRPTRATARQDSRRSGQVGGSRHRPDALLADRGNDHDNHRRLPWHRGIRPVITKRGEPHGTGLGIFHYVIAHDRLARSHQRVTVTNALTTDSRRGRPGRMGLWPPPWSAAPWPRLGQPLRGRRAPLPGSVRSDIAVFARRSASDIEPLLIYLSVSTYLLRARGPVLRTRVRIRLRPLWV